MAHRSESDYARALKFLTTWLEERGDIEWLVQEVLGRYAELGEDRSIVEQLLRIAFPKAGKQPISGLIANVRGTILRPQYRRQSPFGWAGLSWGLRSICTRRQKTPRLKRGALSDSPPSRWTPLLLCLSLRARRDPSRAARSPLRSCVER